MAPRPRLHRGCDKSAAAPKKKRSDKPACHQPLVPLRYPGQPLGHHISFDMGDSIPPHEECQRARAAILSLQLLHRSVGCQNGSPYSTAIVVGPLSVENVLYTRVGRSTDKRGTALLPRRLGVYRGPTVRQP